MKILFCSYSPLSREWGAARAVLEIADSLVKLGCECVVVGPAEMSAELQAPLPKTPAEYAPLLREFLRRRAADFDVVDYPYDLLPYPRSEFPARTLFVARSVLLAHHFLSVKIPEAILLRQRLKRFVTGVGRRQQRAFADQIVTARLTMENADCVNVLNDDDKAALSEVGIAPEKIAVIANGLNEEERRVLSPLNQQPPPVPRLCFLGTFDDRKGGADLPRLFAAVRQRVGNCELRLIGTAGFHRTRERVLAFFPRHLRQSVEVIARFRRDELPGLLEGCSVGVFPSYVEGFGLAVLEMMMAGIPVVAYRSPGPTTMLSDPYLVPRGDVPALTARVLRWLDDEAERQRDAAWARQRARDFTWEAVGAQTADVYRRAVRQMPTAL